MKVSRKLSDLILIGVLIFCGASFLSIVWLFWSGLGKVGDYQLSHIQEVVGLFVVIPLFFVFFFFALYTLIQDVKREKILAAQNTKLSPEGISITFKNISILTRKKNLIILLVILFLEFIFFAIVKLYK